MQEKIKNHLNIDFNDIKNSRKNEKEFNIERSLVDEFSVDFEYGIRKRGYEYYNSNNVLSVFKNKNKYYAKVEGNDIVPYNVSIEVTDDGLEYDCTCPCTYPCKHEYATLLAIDNKEYTEVELKPPIKEANTDLKTIIEKIPAEEIKTYLLSPVGQNKVIFEMKAFINQFRKYYPAQEYEYYYNNLFNALILDDNYEKTMNDYLKNIKQYISGNEFKEVFNIIKAIISAYNDTNKLNYDDYIIDILPKLGMYLRVAYRKSTKKVKQEIDKWLKELENANYYDNYYLEDVVLSVHNK